MELITQWAARDIVMFQLEIIDLIRKNRSQSDV